MHLHRRRGLVSGDDFRLCLMYRFLVDDGSVDNFAGPARADGAIRLVVVNQHTTARGLLVGRLSGSFDIEVVGVAGTVAGAVAVARSSRADVVLTEAVLPDGSGDEVCRRLRRDDNHGCGCVVLSGLPRLPGTGAAPAVDAFVLKELVGGSLESEIRRVAALVRARVPG